MYSRNHLASESYVLNENVEGALTPSRNNMNTAIKNVAKKTGLIALSAVLMGIPTVSFAANYAYVNHAGEVNMIIADSPTEALNTAPGIGVHSGVMILNSQSDQTILDDTVAGA